MTDSSRVFEPPFFPFSVVRTSAYESLTANHVPPAKLVAITAPTGYGKTVLMSGLHAHFQRSNCTCYWISLDDRDVSVIRLIRYLEAMLIPSDHGMDLIQAMNQGSEALEHRITALQDSLSRLAGDVVVFIDNINHCTDESLKRLLDALVFRTPASIYFAIAGTGPLSMDMTRAKLEGRVRVLGFGDLSFSNDEIRQLLGASLDARLGDKSIDMLLKQTEGWPAALRLMQILLSETDNPQQELAEFSGANEDLAKLLNRELLESFDERERRFLLGMSLLRTFGVNLCVHATGEERSAEYIDRLVRNNLFIIPLDRNRVWYRLHGLFREFLLGEAERKITVERRNEILRRAAEWCEHGGRWSDSIDYALEANSLPLVSSILDRVAAMFVRDQGDLHQYIDWVERLHAGGAQCGLEANYWYVWALTFHRRFERARQQRDQLLKRILNQDQISLNETELKAFKRRIEVIGIGIDIYTDHLASGQRNALRWLEESGDEDEPFHFATVAFCAAICHDSANELAKANDVLRIAQSNMAQARSDYGQGWLTLLTAAVALHKGEFAPTHEKLLSALTQVRSKLGENSGIADAIALLAAKSAVEMGLDTEARQLLSLGLRKFQTQGVIVTAAFGVDVAVKLWNGDNDSKFSVARLRQIAGAYPPRMALMLSCFLIRRLLNLGRIDEAMAEAERIGIGSASEVGHTLSLDGIDTASLRDLITAAEIELHIAAGRLKRAEKMVAAQISLARNEGRVGRLVELALDETTISLRSHNPLPATRHLTRAIGLAARWGYLRPFNDRAEMVATIVNETKAKDWRFAIDEEQRFFASICRNLPLHSATLNDHLDEMNIVAQLSESPTTRELEVLALVEAGLSNQQLADRLSVSVATVKWHLHNLYAKLGVSSRSAALARARALNLLAR